MSTLNLELATTILPQVIVPGERFIIDFHVHYVDGNNFHWTTASGGPYTPVATLTVGSVSITATSTVVSAAGGTATSTFTAAQTATLPSNSWGMAVLYADPSTGSENLHVASIQCRTTAEVIP
jgi:hypothetical protein